MKNRENLYTLRSELSNKVNLLIGGMDNDKIEALILDCAKTFSQSTSDKQYPISGGALQFLSLLSAYALTVKLIGKKDD